MRMTHNKKGAGTSASTLAVGSVLIFLLVGSVYMLGGFGGTSQTIVNTPTGGAVSGGNDLSSVLREGEAITYRVFARDQEIKGPIKTAVAAELWVRGQDADGKYQLKTTNTTLSATARTNVNSVVGEKVTFCAFNAGYYGDAESCESEVVAKQSGERDIKVHLITPGVKITKFDINGQVAAGPDNGDFNITLGASQDAALKGFVVENNKTTSMYRLKALAFNITESTMDGIHAKGANGATLLSEGAEGCIVPSRRSGDTDWMSCVPQAVELHEFDQYNFGNIAFDTKDGSNPASIGSAALIDEQYFATNDGFKKGMQNQASPATDVGALDFTLSMNLI